MIKWISIILYYCINFFHYRIFYFLKNEKIYAVIQKFIFLAFSLVLFEYVNFQIQILSKIQKSLFQWVGLNYNFNIDDFSYSLVMNSLDNKENNILIMILVLLIFKISINIYNYFMFDLFTDNEMEASSSLHSPFWNMSSHYNNREYLLFSKDNQKLPIREKLKNINFLNIKYKKKKDERIPLFLLCSYLINLEIILSILPFFIILSLFNFFWIFSLFNFIIVLVIMLAINMIILYGIHEYFSQKYYDKGKEYYKIVDSNKKIILKQSFLKSCKR